MADINAFLGRVMRGGFQHTNQFRCKLDLTRLFANQVGTFGGGTGTADDPYRRGVESRLGFGPAIELLREGLICRTTVTPSRTIDTTTVDLAGGYDETYAIGTTYNNIDCTFLCPLIDGTNPVLAVFHAWQNLIQNRGTAGGPGFVGGDDMVLAFPETYRLAQGMRLELFTGHMAYRDPDRGTEGGSEFVGPVQENLGYDSPKPSLSTVFEYFDVYPVAVNGTTVEWTMRDEMMEVGVSFSYTHWKQVRDGYLDQ
jgi:hypothetical protein